MKTARIVSVSLLMLGPLAGTAARAEETRRSLADALATIRGKKVVDLTDGFSPVSPVGGGFGFPARAFAILP